MAKYTRHDNRNKKRNKHKQISKFGNDHKVKFDDCNRNRDKRKTLEC